MANSDRHVNLGKGATLGQCKFLRLQHMFKAGVMEIRKKSLKGMSGIFLECH